MTYTNIIASLDNTNYIGKINQPVRREGYRADITIRTNTRLYTRTVFAKTHLSLMRNEQYEITRIIISEQRRYNFDLRKGFIDETEPTPELIDIKIVETDKEGNVREI